MKRSIMALAATLLTASVTLAACGGGTPSKDDLADQFKDSGGGVITDEIADCIADKLLDSDLSDDQLNAVADDDKSGLSDDEQSEVLDVITSASTDCATQ